MGKRRTLAVLTILPAALIVVGLTRSSLQGQERVAGKTSFRYEFVTGTRDVRVLDRSTGAIYAVRPKSAAYYLDPVRGQGVVRPLKVVKQKASKGKPTWPKRGSGLVEGPLRYKTVSARFGWSRRTAVFDQQTGKVYVVDGYERFVLIDPIGGTVTEGKLRVRDATGGILSIRGNEAAAIGALKTIGTSQSLFREGDKEGDTTLDYGSLKELGRARLIDKVLASGTKKGYTFTVSYSPTTSEFLWYGTANPIKPGKTGARYFATNMEGVTYYSTKGPIKIDPNSCQIPPGAQPVGK